MSEAMEENNPIVYLNNSEEIEIVLNNENVWATQKSISDIFSTDSNVIAEHLRNIFSEGELEESGNVNEMHIAGNTKPATFYSLDAIISTGYRVNSKKATHFRMWANNVLKQYIKDGFVINEELLRSDPEKLNELAAKLRELRANEKNIYASVRECFKLSASDYEPSSKEVKKFYYLLQDKFHHAITRMTSQQLILDRANHVEENMGLQTIKGKTPTLKDVTTGKNYLDEVEIYRMHLLSEQFLLYAESTALSGKKMTMLGLHQQLDNVLKLNGYPVFDGYINYLKNRAMDHAKREYEIFLEIRKLEFLGVKVDLQLFYLGEYDDYKEQTSQVTSRQLSKEIAVQPA